MLDLPDEVDPWTLWTLKDLEIAENGRKFALETNLVISALLRNAEKELPYIHKKLNLLSSLFNRVHVIIMENDSKDKTRKILLEWVQGKPWDKGNVTLECVHPETFEINTPECHLATAKNNNIRYGCTAGRIERMVFLRNQLHIYTCDWLRKNLSYTFALYADLDLHGIIYRRGICHTFGKFLIHPHIQVIGFRGTSPNGWLWDPFAFEAFEELKAYTAVGQFLNCRSGTRKINFSQGLIRVSCSFSGGTFIRVRDLKPEFRFERVYLIKNFLAICEHVPFYRNFNYFYINTQMVQTHAH